MKKELEYIFSPVEGNIIDLEKVPEPAFAGGLLGRGFAVEPVGNVFCSPIDGKVVLLPPTYHAVGLRSDSGMQLLLHVGIDTVKLQGRGFHSLVQPGQVVKKGDALLEVERNSVEVGSEISWVSPVVVINPEDYEWVEENKTPRDEEPVLVLRKK